MPTLREEEEQRRRREEEAAEQQRDNDAVALTAATKAVAGLADETEPDTDVTSTQGEMERAEADYLDAVESANAARQQSFSDVVNDYYQRMKDEEERMKDEEQGNKRAAALTGATELAAGIANLLAVGGGNASHQQYRQYSQEWMSKADADIKEHRRRRDSMHDALQELRAKQDDLRAADSVETAKIRAQQARTAYADALARQKAAEDAEEKEWKRAVTERQLENDEKKTDASIRQGWETINNNKEKQKDAMLKEGYVPDSSAPGGYRYDAELSRKIQSGTGTGTGNRHSFPILDGNGKVSIARLHDKEVEYLRSQVESAIQQDFGDKDVEEFRKEYARAADDNNRNSVLNKWISKSKTCKEIIRKMDPGYMPQQEDNASISAGTGLEKYD